MKTSEVIERLKALEGGIPFDADVVTGDDWQPQKLTRIYHEPPHTFLEFEENHEVRGIGPDEEVLISHFVSNVVQRISEASIDQERAQEALYKLVLLARNNSAEDVTSFIRSGDELR